MRRPRHRKSPTEVSLFPFLAVLICTMGGLIVLLVMVVQQARLDAQTVSETRRQASVQQSDLQELRRERAENRWRQSLLAEQRSEKTEELAERRLELGHLEEHLRELQGRWRQLNQELELARQQRDQQGDDTTSLEEQVQQLRDAIRQTTEKLEQARRQLAEEPVSFTIVPYRGPNGTRRRPIYLECTAQGVLVQPAGMLLPASDFEGPLGPGNPLDAVLRAIREYWQRTPLAEGEPYPLLLVRPDGVDAYAAARAALRAWDDEFGYELVEADLPLNFPPEDAALRPLLEQTVRAARDRQRLLAAALPRRFQGSTPTGFVATAQGFVPIGDARRPSGSERSGNSERTRRSSGTGSGRFGGDASRSGFGPADGGEYSGQGEWGAGPDGVQTARNPAGRETTPGLGADGQARGGSPGMDASAGMDGSLGTDGSAGMDGSAGAERGTDRTAAASGSWNRTAGQTGDARGGSASGGSSSGGSSSGGPTGGSAAAGHLQPGRSGNLSGGSVMGGLAESRGADWALPRSNRNSTGVTRPLHVACYPDRLVILPDPGDRRPPRAVLLPDSTAKGIDAFVSAVWEVMDGWGIALAGGYWKPVLKVDVQPGAEQRFQELQTLLGDSGLIVTRKQP